MSWIAPALLALAVAALLWRAKMGAAWIAAGLAFAAGGYALTGAPTQPGSPTEDALQGVDAEADSGVESTRQALARDPVNIPMWGAYAAALGEAGRTGEAVEALSFAIETLPENADLEVYLGTALMAHAEGVMTPAAELAFARAEEIAPDHPAPPYFLGLAYLQQGDPASALGVWRALMARTPPDAPWRADLTRKIEAAETMQAAGVGG